MLVLATTYFSTLRFSGEPLAWLLAFGALGLCLTFSGMSWLIMGLAKKSSRVSGTALIAAGLMALGGGMYVSLTSAEASYKNYVLHQQLAMQLNHRYGKLIRIVDFSLTDGDVSFTVGHVRSCTYGSTVNRSEYKLFKVGGGEKAVAQWVIGRYTDAKQQSQVSIAGFRQLATDCDGQMPQD